MGNACCSSNPRPQRAHSPTRARFRPAAERRQLQQEQQLGAATTDGSPMTTADGNGDQTWPTSPLYAGTPGEKTGDDNTLPPKGSPKSSPRQPPDADAIRRELMIAEIEKQLRETSVADGDEEMSESGTESDTMSEVGIGILRNPLEPDQASPRAAALLQWHDPRSDGEQDAFGDDFEVPSPTAAVAGPSYGGSTSKRSVQLSRSGQGAESFPASNSTKSTTTGSRASHSESLRVGSPRAGRSFNMERSTSVTSMQSNSLSERCRSPRVVEFIEDGEMGTAHSSSLSMRSSASSILSRSAGNSFRPRPGDLGYSGSQHGSMNRPFGASPGSPGLASPNGGGGVESGSLSLPAMLSGGTASTTMPTSGVSPVAKNEDAFQHFAAF